jgi:hypothetical protein|mmetsp:Transcript_3200/g.4327  ORF Transcript_3200/g.4327 Transcript_3200/m.4327 type:complete len:123 (-) Transcript_3200:422-790(-)
MKLSLFAAVAAALFASTGEAANLRASQQAGASENVVEMIQSLELTQAEAATMSEAEIEARAATIADLFLSANVDSEVDAEAKAEFISHIGSFLRQGVNMLSTTVLPILALIIGFKLISPFAC